jgi:segregation and condensation protein B
MSLRPQLEAIIYAAETPITVDQILFLVKDSALAETPGIDLTEVKSRVRATLEELIADYSRSEHGIEIRQVAGGYRMSTKPDQHDVVRAFAKTLKPPFRLSLPALETLAVIAYKQPVTVPEISEIRGVDSGGVIATLLDRKLITTSGRKAVIGRPILYKTSKEFLLRFGLKDVNELPSMEEFEKLLSESFQSDLLPSAEQADEAPSNSIALVEEEPDEETGDETDLDEKADGLSTSVEATASAEPAAGAELSDQEVAEEEVAEEIGTPASTNRE